MTKLNQATIEKLKYYVYLLRDPRNKRVFYVGKGKGNRINQHSLRALIDIKSPSEKNKIIQAISSSSREPELLVLRHGITESEAFELESAAIDLINQIQKDPLSNLVKGHGASDRGLMTLLDLDLKYQAEPVKQFKHKALLITINRRFLDAKTARDLYNVTRGSWRMRLSKTDEIQIVCAVYRGIIREVYEPRKWQTDPKRKPRIMFEGKIAKPDIRKLYLHKSVKHLIKQGSSNPIKYISAV
ncbi:MAG TPA: hypothetical protein PKD34_02455 [Candidatus Doudnabacteria bacterium]|nr:hypothetical protein [Candidatus Doudnabacteria bacterium]